MCLMQRKNNLRIHCEKLYGPEFTELYDKVCAGVPIGSKSQTLMFLDMVESARRDLKDRKKRIKNR